MADRMIRLFVKCSGQERCFMKVEERSNDQSLLVVPSKPSQMSTGSLEGYHDMKEWRLSIHPADDDPYIFIKQHVVFTSGLKEHLYTRVVPNGKYTSWLAFMHSVSDLSGMRYERRMKGKFERVEVAEYSSDENTFVYGVVVTSKNLRPRPPVWMRATTIEFNKFNLTVFHSFMSIPSTGRGTVIMPLNRRKISIDDSINEQTAGHYIESCTARSLLGYLSVYARSLSKLHLQIIDDQFPNLKYIRESRLLGTYMPVSHQENSGDLVSYWP